jgi:hypothetical protein
LVTPKPTPARISTRADKVAALYGSYVPVPGTPTTTTAG